MKEPGGPALAAKLVHRLDRVAKRLEAEFPDRYSETKRTLAGHIARARKTVEARAEAPGGKERHP